MSDDERARAAGFAIESLRRRFIVRRGLLRSLLASYLGADPEELRFAYGPRDKPRLVGRTAWEDLKFNSSHSHATALVAVTEGRDVGIDLEKMRHEVDIKGIASRYFAPSEVARLECEPTSGQLALFFRLWTSKEAWIKTRGGGLSMPLDQFEIRLGSGKDPALVTTPGDRRNKSSGYVHELPVGSDHAAAVAVAESGLSIHLREWTAEMAVVEPE